jgi:hypothetical protein
LKAIGVSGKIILKYILKKQSGDVDWIDLAQDKGGLAGSCKHGNEYANDK